MKFNKNIGTTDRTIRLVVGAMLIFGAIMGIIGWWGYIGIVPAVTALIRICPLYTLLKMDTCSGK